MRASRVSRGSLNRGGVRQIPSPSLVARRGRRHTARPSFPGQTVPGGAFDAMAKQTYDPSEIEPRWQEFWQARDVFRTPNPGDPDFDAAKPKFYVLDMFPYPSGAGLHVGHPEGYTAPTSSRATSGCKGFNVLHPMGWDAFGLPAEQHAIQTGHPPARSPRSATSTTSGGQMRSARVLSYDWNARDRRRPTPEYVPLDAVDLRSSLYERGLAYQEAEFRSTGARRSAPYWPTRRSSTASSERGGHPVRAPCQCKPVDAQDHGLCRPADRRTSSWLDWPEPIKKMQRDWIGRSEGARGPTSPSTVATGPTSEVFTTRPGHAVRRDLHGAGTRAPAVDTRDDRRPAAARSPRPTEGVPAQKSDVDRHGPGRTHARRLGVYALGAYGDQSAERRADPGVDRRLRPR